MSIGRRALDSVHAVRVRLGTGSAHLAAHHPAERRAFRAWANGEFVAGDGSVNEVDLVLITTAGVSLVEIKSWQGLSGDGTTWQQAHRAPVDNPVRLVNRKARKFKSLLQATPAMRGLRAPWVEGIVLLSNPELDVDGLAETGRAHVYGRSQHRGLPDLLEHLRGGGSGRRRVRPPACPGRRAGRHPAVPARPPGRHPAAGHAGAAGRAGLARLPGPARAVSR